MKTKLFIYSIIDRKISRTYGGSTYTVNVYEVTKNNDLEFIADHKACTRSHKGEGSEAFGALLKAKPEIKKLLIRRAKAVLKNDTENYNAKTVLRDIDNSGGYYNYCYKDFGVNLRSTGGA